MQEAFLERIPFLLTGALTPFPAQLSAVRVTSDEFWPLLLAWGVVCVAILLLFSHLRRDPVARFMALGAILSLLPRAAAFPHNRLLLLPTIGSAWVLASYVTTILRARRLARPDSTKKATFALWFQRIVAVIILVLHGIVAPIKAVDVTNYYIQFGKRMSKSALESEMPGPEEARGARVILAVAPGYDCGLAAGIRLLAGIPFPEAVWGVTPGNGDYLFTRTGLQSFSLKIVSHDFFVWGMDALLCREELNFRKGDKFRQGAMEVTVVDAVNGKIREISVVIDRPLDHPDVWLLVWNGERYVRQRVPPWKPSGKRRRGS
jgi:hypothetical protein